MKMLTVMQGISGAGKTTAALKIVETTGASLVSRDELRKSFRNSPSEEVLSLILLAVAEELLDDGKNVVVDSWNMEAWDVKMWTGLAEKKGVKLVFEKLDTPLDECIRRDSLRQMPVGEMAIRSAALQYGLA